ncbi:hypothetical protein CDD83_716 [Cordyceps sp. RAO-2017]|nr:hypothetical protein CDD83_716 [Cordyceps sp. RAO-2017]
MEPPRERPISSPDRAGMNHERAAMLSSGRGPSSSPNEPRGRGPLLSGANVVALGEAPRERSKSLKRESEEPAWLPPRWRYCDEPLTDPQQFVYDDRMVPPRPEALGPESAPNADSGYLSSLLRPRLFRLILESPPTENGAPMVEVRTRWVTDAGLVLNEIVRMRSDVPVLRLPSPGGPGPGPLNCRENIDRVAHGFLLEDVWAGLSPMAKYDMARKLRRIVGQMRKTAQPVARQGPRRAGSIFSGRYSLLLDESHGHSYFTVRREPTGREFINFLVSTLAVCAPKAVAASIVAELGEPRSNILAHSSLCPRNIVVNDGQIVGLISWDNAGWYPEWWDYVKFFETDTIFENRDWYDYAGEIFEKEYQRELVAYRAIVGHRS